MITDKGIKNLKPKEKRYTVALGESLFLRISPTGCKSWVLRYYCKGPVKDITLGTWPQLKVLQAVQAAHLKRQELDIKPSKGLTFSDGFRLWKNKKRHTIVSYEDEVERIEMHLIPDLGRKQLEDVTAPVVLNTLEKLNKKLPTLKRCLMRLNEILDLCVYAGLLRHNPCKGMSKIFAKHSPVPRPFIPAADLHILFTVLKNSKKNNQQWFHCYLLWALYTMLRPVECSSVRWRWIDGNTLTIPASFIKSKRDHRVHLCPEILELLKIAKSLRKKRSVYVWPFGRGGKKISKQHISKWLNNTSLKGKLCHHGMRATGRTWLKDQGAPYEVGEDAIAHVTGTTYSRSYLRSDYLEQRRPHMQTWWYYIYEQYCACCAPLLPQK